MSTNTIVTFPPAYFIEKITAAVVGLMNKEKDGYYATVLAADGKKVTLEVNEDTVMKLPADVVTTPEKATIPVGGKIYFEADGSVKSAVFVTPDAKPAAAPKTATRTSGSYERPAASKAFGR